MRKKLAYTPELGKAVAFRANDKTQLKYHVISSEGGNWVVVSHGALRALRSFSTLRAASLFARRYAASRSAKEVVIHSKDGTVKDRIAIAQP